MERLIKDDRFSAALKDPRFKKVPKSEQKTKIDKRFQVMFKGENFNTKYMMDKRGQDINCSSSEYLKRFYSYTSSECDSSSDDDESDKNKSDNNKNKSSRKNAVKFRPHHDLRSTESEDNKASDELNISSSDLEDSDEDEENVDKWLNDHSPASLESSSSSEDSDGDDYDGGKDIENEEEIDHRWQELDADAVVTEEATERLAICNMDWDRMRAEDILVVFNSFKPADGIIHSVKIYPSEYGLQRMTEENLHGPRELVNKTISSDNGEKYQQHKEGSRYHREKLRQYQMNRLKYYYAVVECDSPQTADILYQQLNGTEYESSAVCLDLRFIPDDVIFDQEPKSEAFSNPDPEAYKPRLFINSALQQVKVNLTWDETDPRRRETIQKAFREPETIEKDIKDYLASSSSDEDNSEAELGNSDIKQMKIKERIANYRSLLQSLEEKEKNNDQEYEMEITWDSGIKEKTEEIVKEKIQKKALTPFEEMLKKKKDEKKLKKKERKLISDNHEDESVSDSNHSDFFENFSNEDIIANDGPKVVKSLKKKKHKEKGLPKMHINDDDDDSSKKAELSLLVYDGMNDKECGSGDYQKGKKKKKKIKAVKEDSFEVDVKDKRFSALYSSHMYNIDPSDPHYKETKGMQAIIQEKHQKRKNRTFDEGDRNEFQAPAKFSKLSNETQNLVRSLKMKTNSNKRKT